MEKLSADSMRKKLSQAVARSTVTDARDIVIVDTQIP